MMVAENSFSSTFFLGKPGSIWQHCVKPQSLLLRFPYLGNPSGDGADLVGAGASVMERKGAVLALRPDVCESREGGVLNAEEISSSAAGWVATDHALWRRTWGSGSVLL